MGKCILEKIQKNIILAALVDCHDPGKIVSREPNTHSGSFNNFYHRYVLHKSKKKIKLIQF